MKKESASRSAFFNPRFLIDLLRTLAMAIGVLLLILKRVQHKPKTLRRPITTPSETSQ